jgi:hypothetical protein
VIGPGLPAGQVAVPLVQVALVGPPLRQLFPPAVTDALPNTPLASVTVAVEPVHPLLKADRRMVPVPLPPVTPVTDASQPHVENGF